MSLKPSKNTMCPINPQRRSQEIINQIINQSCSPFYTKNGGGSCQDFSTNTRRSRIPENAAMPSDYSGDTLLCKQCQVSHMSPSRPPDKTDSASHIPSSVCPRLCLHLVPIGSNDRVWALVTSDSQHKASEWDSGCHYRGSWLPPAWAYLILRLFGGGFHPQSVTHCCTLAVCLATLCSFIVTASLSFTLAPHVNSLLWISLI